MPSPVVAALVDALASHVTALAKRNDAHIPAERDLTYYDSLTVPPVPLAAILERWAEYVPEAEATLLAAAIFIEKFCAKKAHGVHSHTMHRLVIAALVVASKYVSDTHLTEVYYENVTGVCVEELWRLQTQFWRDLDFELHVDDEEYQRARGMYLADAAALPREHKVVAAAPAADAVTVEVH